MTASELYEALREQHEELWNKHLAQTAKLHEAEAKLREYEENEKQESEEPNDSQDSAL